MRNSLTKSLSLILALFCTAMAAWADTKIKGKYSSSGQITETTIYTKGMRQRFEYGGEVAMITQCDLKRMIQINDRARAYLVVPLDAPSATPTPLAGPGQPNPTAQVRRGVVTYTTAITDTGERRQMFGFTARRLKSSMTKEVSPEACDQKKERVETDGWYIDFAQNSTCLAGPAQSVSGNPGCADEIRHKQVGEGKLGYPLIYTLTTYGEDGQSSSAMTMEVVELSTAQIEAALFEAPAGYTEAKNYQELAALSSGGSGSNTQSGTATKTVASHTVEAKRPGALRIGVADLNNRTGQSVSIDSLSDQLTGLIREAKIDAVGLDAKSTGEIRTEAQQKQCDYVLYTDIAEVKKSSASKFGGFLSKASSMGGMGAAAGGTPKDKHEARLEFKLLSVNDAATQLSSSVKGNNGGGFNWKSAVQLASNVAPPLLMMHDMKGFDPRIMNMLMNVQGGAYGSPFGGFDPAMTSLMFMMNAANPDASQAKSDPSGESEAIGDALENIVKSVVAEVRKRK